MNNLDLSAPQGWNALDRGQLKFLFHLIARCQDRTQLKLLYLLRYNSASVVSLEPDGTYLLRVRGSLWKVDPLSLAEAIESHLSWLDKWPDYPVRIDRLGRRKAVAADFAGVSFEDWLIIDSLYQAYLQSNDDDRLDDMTEVLYGRRMTLRPDLRVMVFFWVASLKELMARLYPHFIRPAGGAGEEETSAPHAGPTQAESVQSQIRALTGGDITKRDTILRTECHLALAELDAMAREAEEMRKKYPEAK